MKTFTSPYQADFSQRDPAEGVDDLFYTRWSPRSFKKVTLPEETLRAVFDAARWAPSCFNEQPWRFITSRRDGADFDRFLKLLNEWNQGWAKNASLLGFIVARRRFQRNDKPNGLATFDCGAAWLSLTLQARRFGLYTHGMGGIKRDEIYPEFDVDPEKHEIICGFALGVLDEVEALGEDYAGDEKPSGREPLDAIWQRDGS